MHQPSAARLASTTKPPEAKPRRRQKPLVIAPPEFVVAEESLFKILDELPPLFARYGKENAKAPVDPDWMTMQRMAAVGGFRIVTARYSGVLVGFCVNLITMPLMYKSTQYGTTIAVWIDKPYRFGMNGMKLIRRNRELLLEWGCKRLYIATDQPRLGKVFERVGYRYGETHYVSANNELASE